MTGRCASLVNPLRDHQETTWALRIRIPRVAAGARYGKIGARLKIWAKIIKDSLLIAAPDILCPLIWSVKIAVDYEAYLML